MFILFREVSVEECSPVISVVAGSIDRPHLAANSKNHQEQSQPCCHLILWMVISIRQMDVSVYRHAENTMGTGLTALFMTLYSC